MQNAKNKMWVPLDSLQQAIIHKTIFHKVLHIPADQQFCCQAQETEGWVFIFLVSSKNVIQNTDLYKGDFQLHLLLSSLWFSTPSW